MRVYAAATIRTACINSPPNREAVFQEDGIARLLRYVGLEMAQVIQEVLDGGGANFGEFALANPFFCGAAYFDQINISNFVCLILHAGVLV